MKGKMISSKLLDEGNVTVRESLRDCDVEYIRYRTLSKEIWEHDGIQRKYYHSEYFKSENGELIKTSESYEEVE